MRACLPTGGRDGSLTLVSGDGTPANIHHAHTITAWYDRYGTISQSCTGTEDALRLFRELFGSEVSGFTSTSSDCAPSSFNTSAGGLASGAHVSEVSWAP